MKQFNSMWVLIILIIGMACSQQKPIEDVTSIQSKELDFIFPKGQLGSSEYFTGKAYNYGLVRDTALQTIVGNVYFEPGARSNWHTHPAGQILVITDGLGYHQIEGQPIQLLKKGDVITCPPNTRHWHGARAETGMQQLYILPDIGKGVVDWMEPVSDEQYTPID